MTGDDREWPEMPGNYRRWPEMPGMTVFRQAGWAGGPWILCERSEARSACAPRFLLLHSIMTWALLEVFQVLQFWCLDDFLYIFEMQFDNEGPSQLQHP